MEDIKEIKTSSKERMQKSLNALNGDFGLLRTGRASAALLDKVHVDYYGVATPLKQLANISLPEAKLIVIQPFDRNSISDIEKAILTSDLGLNPGNDGKTIRIIVPPLNEERRRELVKQARQMGEKAKISIRNIRRDINEKIKISDSTEDEKKRLTQDIQKITDDFIQQIEKVLVKKENEIMEV